MHWLKMGDIPEIWRRLEEAGITTVQACGDSARNVLCCPVSGLDHEEVIDAYPIAQAISDYFTGNREYANLPRKFKMSVTGCLEDCAQAEINDIGMLPARLEDGTIGFNLRVGGGLSDGPRMASDIDVFVRPEEAVEITRGIAQVFGELGDRENRWTARMRYLVQKIGPEAFREELQKRVSLELTPAGEDLTKHYRGDHVGVHAQKDGLYYVGLNVPVGRMSGEQFVEAGRLAEEYGSEVRLATDQNLVITGVSGGSHRRPARGAAPGAVLAEARGLRARGRGVHGERVLPVRDRGDQDPGRRVGQGDGRARRGRRPGGRQDALLRLLGLVRPAPDRGRRLPRRDRQDEDLHRRGRGHRPRRVSGPRRGVYRLGRGREADRRGPGRAGLRLREVQGGGARGRAVPRVGPAQEEQGAARGVAQAREGGGSR